MSLLGRVLFLAFNLFGNTVASAILFGLPVVVAHSLCIIVAHILNRHMPSNILYLDPE